MIYQGSNVLQVHNRRTIVCLVFYISCVLSEITALSLCRRFICLISSSFQSFYKKLLKYATHLCMNLVYQNISSTITENAAQNYNFLAELFKFFARGLFFLAHSVYIKSNQIKFIYFECKTAIISTKGMYM